MNKEDKNVSLHHSLGHSFALIVAGSRSDRIDMTPVGLLLRMDLRIAVHLRGRGEEHAGLGTLGESEHVEGAFRTSLNGLDGVVLEIYEK